MQPQHNEQPKIKSLSITKGLKQKLTKNQDAFNKLTQRIEKLQKEITKKSLQFDLALKIYGTEFYPALLKIVEGRHKLIVVLWNIFKSNKLSKADQRHLKKIIQFHFQEYLIEAEGEASEDLKNIYFDLEGVSFDKIQQHEAEIMHKEMQAAFEELNIDMTGVDINDPAAMEAKVAEAKQKMLNEEQEFLNQSKFREDNKKKSKKQLESEKMQKAVDEMKQKNISTIYKQLAKLFHPDLEQDEDKKADKEILMKELTAAYEAKNLHALLTLELKWIHKETNHLESLTEEKLAVYLQILREQASSLEREKFQILQQPQYSILAGIFGYSIQSSPVDNLRKHVKAANETILNFERDIIQFESAMALRNVKEMIRQWKQKETEFNDDELMNLFFD